MVARSSTEVQAYFDRTYHTKHRITLDTADLRAPAHIAARPRATT